jgi:WD40 repeat protein
VELVEPGLIATASADKTIRTWKLPSLKSGVCQGHMDFVTCLAVVQDEEGSEPLLVSGSCDKTIRLWDLKKVTTTRQKKENFVFVC